MSKNGKKWAVGALLLGIGGYIAGILTAPKSGKETREDIKTNANRVISEAEKELKKLHAELTVVIEDSKKAFSRHSGKAKIEADKAMSLAKEKQAKVRELLSALRDGGESDNPELKKAMKEASEAIKHLKKFLK